MTIVAKRFHAGQPPLTREQISTDYDLPIRMVNRICERLKNAGLVNAVIIDQDTEAITPAFDTEEITVGTVLQRLDSEGNPDFIPGFKSTYAKSISKIDGWFEKCYRQLKELPLSEVPLPDFHRDEKGD